MLDLFRRQPKRDPRQSPSQNCDRLRLCKACLSSETSLFHWRGHVRNPFFFCGHYRRLVTIRVF